MMHILHIYSCCHKGYKDAKRLWQTLIDKGVPSVLESSNGYRHKDLISKFCLDKNTKLPLVVLDNDVVVACKDLNQEYCNKIAEIAKRGLDKKDK